MDKNHYFPVWHGTKSEPVKVVCNGQGWILLEKAGFVKDVSLLKEKKDNLDSLKEKQKGGSYEGKRTNS